MSAGSQNFSWTRAFVVGADDGSRTRTVSLGRTTRCRATVRVRKRRSASSANLLSPPEGAARLDLQEALTDDRLAVALVEVAGRAGSETLDGERAVLVLRVQDGRFVEFWSHHYDQQNERSLVLRRVAIADPIDRPRTGRPQCVHHTDGGWR